MIDGFFNNGCNILRKASTAPSVFTIRSRYIHMCLTDTRVISGQRTKFVPRNSFSICQLFKLVHECYLGSQITVHHVLVQCGAFNVSIKYLINYFWQAFSYDGICFLTPVSVTAHNLIFCIHIIGNMISCCQKLRAINNVWILLL